MKAPKSELSRHQVLSSSPGPDRVALNPLVELERVSFVSTGVVGPSGAGSAGHVVTFVSKSVTNTSVEFSSFGPVKHTFISPPEAV